MTYKQIFTLFEACFPQFEKRVETWFPDGKNSVRIRWANGEDFVLTYRKNTNWRLETVDSFIDSMKGEF